MYRCRRHHHRRAWRGSRQAAVHGCAVHASDADRDVHVALGVRSGAALESRQGGAHPQLLRMALGAVGTERTVSTSLGTLEISDRIRDARARREPFRIVGRGTWLDAGQPCAATTRLDVGGLSGITRYEPGDFVLTARAGTTLGDIASATAEFGQWVTLDPPGGNDGTIGAVIATASYGPLASAYGT